MTRVLVSSDVNAPLDRVWAKIRDNNAVLAWQSAIADSQLRMIRVGSSLSAFLTTLFVTLVVALGAPILAEARITRIEITRVESPTFEGVSFGDVGRYEKLVGRAFGEVDPADPRNAVIVDVGLAPRNARGMVEYSADVYILRPVDRANGNHRVFFEINNRGNNLSFGQINNTTTGGNNPTTAADAGIGFLMRQGYTIVWSGWDATVAPGGGRFTITVPVAKNPDGSSIVGPALEEFVIDNATTMTGTLAYPAATLDKSQASLSVRVHYTDPPEVVPAAGWEYVNDWAIRLLPAGTPFQQGRLYEFAYTAKKVRRAAEQLRFHRLLLDEDVERYINAAEASSIGKFKPSIFSTP